MATGNAKRLVEIAFAPTLARELAAQVSSGTGKKARLAEDGLTPDLAKRVANYIGGTATSVNKFTELGMVGPQVR
jgi:hypothetical protein